jgi:hypothetical protein
VHHRGDLFACRAPHRDALRHVIDLLGVS